MSTQSAARSIEGNTRIRRDGRERHDIHHAARLTLRCEQLILQTQKLLRKRARRTHIHQRAQKPLLLLTRHTDLRRLRAILRHLSEEHSAAGLT